MKFDEVIGQEEVKERLLQMTREGRLPHAIMLCGPQGVGKKALAVAFACHLLGESRYEVLFRTPVPPYPRAPDKRVPKHPLV